MRSFFPLILGGKKRGEKEKGRKEYRYSSPPSLSFWGLFDHLESFVLSFWEERRRAPSVSFRFFSNKEEPFFSSLLLFPAPLKEERGKGGTKNDW